jgi:hypothetical protein
VSHPSPREIDDPGSALSNHHSSKNIAASFRNGVEKRRYRVRLNGADHQWGKDPPKEVVG